MVSAKINLLLLPLFVSILLSTVSKLKIGNTLDQFFFGVLSPLTKPVSALHLYTEKQKTTIKNLPALEKQNRDQKNQIATLIYENEYLKQSITDKKVLDNLKSSFTKIVPVRLTGSSGKFIVTSSLSLADVQPGQPLISNNILLGTVKDISANTITITPLDSDKSPAFPVRTISGQKGLYKYENNNSQIVDVPSQSPIILGDMIITEPGELFPGNLIVGKTTRLLTVSQEPLQKAEIALYDSIDNIDGNLAIITKP